MQVNDPEKYGFQPKALLNSLTDIYLHLDSEQFARAVGNDEVKASLTLPPSLPPSLSPRPSSLPLSLSPSLPLP